MIVCVTPSPRLPLQHNLQPSSVPAVFEGNAVAITGASSDLGGASYVSRYLDVQTQQLLRLGASTPGRVG